MTRKKRDYRAEYKRRIERALAKGYSRSVARGHAKTKTRTYKDRHGKKQKETVHVELGIRAAKFLGEAPGAKIADVLARDAKFVFGPDGVPKRRKKEDRTAYQERLDELTKYDGTFDWTSEVDFIEQMKAIGLTEREAYTHWFSP